MKELILKSVPFAAVGALIVIARASTSNIPPPPERSVKAMAGEKVMQTVLCTPTATPTIPPGGRPKAQPKLK